MNNPMMMLQQLKMNPMQFLMSRRLNVPQNMINNPNAIVNHLLQTGQISQEQLNRAYQQMSQMRGNLH